MCYCFLTSKFGEGGGLRGGGGIVQSGINATRKRCVIKYLFGFQIIHVLIWRVFMWDAKWLNYWWVG